jgi:hypothetical protein
MIWLLMKRVEDLQSPAFSIYLPHDSSFIPESVSFCSITGHRVDLLSESNLVLYSTLCFWDSIQLYSKNKFIPKTWDFDYQYLHLVVIVILWFLYRANRINNFSDDVNEGLISHRKPKVRISENNWWISFKILYTL